MRDDSLVKKLKLMNSIIEYHDGYLLMKLYLGSGEIFPTICRFESGGEDF